LTTDGSDRKQQVMELLANLYSSTTADHIVNPRNMGDMDNPDGFARVTGPCGDTMAIWLKVINGNVRDASFAVDGCATTVACGSMVTELAKSGSIMAAKGIRQQDVLKALGGLPEESEHCALLAADTLQAAIRDYQVMQREPWKKAYRKY
jgi:nitrogen fixation NifU-like protein